MFKNVGKNLKTVGFGIGGAIGAKFIKNKLLPMLPIPEAVKPYEGVITVAAGLILMEQKGDLMQDIGLGLAIGAGGDLVAEHVPGIHELTGEDMSGLAEKVINGINEEMEEIIKDKKPISEKVINDQYVIEEEMNEELSGGELEEELSDDMGEELSEEVGEELS